MICTQTYVYADILFLVNFSMDYLCLYISAKILRRALPAGRMLLSSALGGIYSVLSLFISAPSPIPFLLDILSCILICAVSFHKKGQIRKTLTAALLFFSVSMAVGGIMTALFNLLNKLDLPLDVLDGDSLSVWGFAILAIVAGGFSMLGGGLIFRKREIISCKLTIKFDGRQKTVCALCDSGNLVRDPISGKPVIILSREAGDGLVDRRITDSFLEGKMSNNAAYSGMHIASVNTATGTSLLVLLHADEMTVSYTDKKHTSEFLPDALFAVGDMKTKNGEYDAIIPYSLFRG